MTVRAYFGKAADAIVQVYDFFDRPGFGFMDLLATRGYIVPEAVTDRMVEKAVHGIFDNAASGIESLTGFVARATGPAYGFFDLLADRGYLPAQAFSGRIVPILVANDNLAPSTGGDRKAA